MRGGGTGSYRDWWLNFGRKLLAQKFTQKKPREVAGGGPDLDFLDALAWLPYADVEAEVKKRCSSSNASTREAGLQCLIRCAGRGGPEPIQDALKFFEARLRNEQDNVRAAVLQHMADVVPALAWQAVHVPSLKQLLTASMQAKGSSSQSLSVWPLLLEALVANGAVLRTEASLAPCGTFGLEVKSQLTAARLWGWGDLAFGALGQGLWDPKP